MIFYWLGIRRFILIMIRFRWSVAFALACTFTVHAQQIIFTPFHKSGIYELGERAGWAVEGSGTYSYEIRKNNRDVIQTGTLNLQSGSPTIETTVSEPAMLYVELLPAAAPGSPKHLGAAIAPWKLQPSVPRPPDFDSFWDSKLKDLSQIPINPVLTPTETTKPGVEFYTVQLASVGSHVQGYLAKPSKEGKFPALVIFQYAGVYALNPETVTDRAAEGWLAFDVDSHDMPPNQATAVSANYQAIGNTSRETSYFLNMYLRDSRAIDYIASRPDWDGKTIVALGTSMGGQQSLVTAGLNPKITAVIVNEPSGADSNGDLHGRKSGYPNWPSDDPMVMQTALYFDTVNFAPRIKTPVLAAIGFIDTTCPPAGIWTALNQIPGPTEVIPMIESDHNHITPQKQEAWNSRSKQVLDQILNGGKFQPDPSLTRKYK
jgi:cephalosporin-C deacetylase-like acetyl esterase